MDCPDGARIFVDASLIGLGIRLAAEDERVIHTQHADWPFDAQTRDEEWLAFVGQCGFTVIMRDKRIRYRPREGELLRRFRIPAIVVATSKNLAVDDQVELVQRHWEEIESAIAKEPGLHHLTMSGLERMVTY